MKKSFVFLILLITTLGFLKEYTAFYFFITLHEIGHILMTKILKEKINKIKFLYIGINANIKNFIFLKKQKKFLILISGPIINLIMYFIFKSINLIDYQIYNLALLFFNLLPIYPLDGGQILELFVEDCGFIPTKIILHKLSIFLSFLLIILGIFQVILFPFNFSILLIGIYLFKYNYMYVKDKNIFKEFYFMLINKPKSKKNKFVFIQENCKTVKDILKFACLNKNLILIINKNSSLTLISEENLIQSILNLDFDKKLIDI